MLVKDLIRILKTYPRDLPVKLEIVEATTGIVQTHEDHLNCVMEFSGDGPRLRCVILTN